MKLLSHRWNALTTLRDNILGLEIEVNDNTAAIAPTE